MSPYYLGFHSISSYDNNVKCLFLKSPRFASYGFGVVTPGRAFAFCSHGRGSDDMQFTIYSIGITEYV